MIDALFARLIGRGPAPPARPARQRLVWPGAGTVYAVGDVHGCLELLVELEQSIAADAALRPGTAAIVLLGDLVDRGPSSAGVLDHLTRPAPAGLTRFVIAGNHEAAMADFLAAPHPRADWLRHGGLETLVSYGIAPWRIQTANRRELAQLVEAHVPVEHRVLLEALPVSIETASHIFVHAGVRGTAGWEQQAEADLMWSSDGFSDLYEQWDRTIVHGHIVRNEVLITPRRIGVDTGAYASGRLSAVRLVEGEPPLVITA